MTDPAKTLSRLPKPRDIMLVPKPVSGKAILARGTNDIFEQNWLFARQWAGAKPDDRVVLELAFGAPLSDLEVALRLAATTARASHDVILLTGHGVAQDSTRSESAFDSLPERGKMITHKHTITAQVLSLPTLADRVSDRWVARKSPGLKVDSGKQALVDSLAPRFDLLTRIGALFKAQNVASFTILSCSIGKDAAFQSSLAKLLSTPVRMYDGLLAMSDEIFTQPREIKEFAWIVPSSERATPNKSKPKLVLPDGSFNRDHAQFHELPPGLLKRSP